MVHHHNYNNLDETTIKNPFEERRRNAHMAANHVLSACVREYGQLARFYIQEKSVHNGQELTHLQEKMHVVLNLGQCIVSNSNLCGATNGKHITRCFLMVHVPRHEFEKIPISQVEACLNSATACLQLTANMQRQQQPQPQPQQRQEQ